MLETAMVPTPLSNLEILNMLDEKSKEAALLLYKLVGFLDESKLEYKKIRKQYKQLLKSRIIVLAEYGKCKDSLAKLKANIKEITVNIELALKTKKQIEINIKLIKDSMVVPVKPLAKVLKFNHGKSKRPTN